MSAAGQRERASKKKKAAGCVSYSPGPFLGGSTSVLRAGYCTVQVPEKHDAGIMRIGNCLNAYCIYLASKLTSKQASRSYVTFLSCELQQE